MGADNFLKASGLNGPLFKSRARHLNKASFHSDKSIIETNTLIIAVELVQIVAPSLLQRLNNTHNRNDCECSAELIQSIHMP